MVATSNSNIENVTELGEAPGHFLDITGDVCPMTFVRTRLLIEKMAPGEIAEILLPEGEPVENVPDSLRELGHKVLRLERAEDAGEGVYRLVVRKL
jgi:TusA-related sulfurtransferase